MGGVTCSVSQSIESTLTPSALPSLLVVSTSSHGDVFWYLLFSYLTFCHEALAIQRVQIKLHMQGTITISALETGGVKGGAGGAPVPLLLL